MFPRYQDLFCFAFLISLYSSLQFRDKDWSQPGPQYKARLYEVPPFMGKREERMLLIPFGSALVSGSRSRV
ncbi:hypothetical protein EI94DRAFT_1767649 [Lactarius quietus]|nr:hypothetical protein EI94DRAFT_1767649 [Lactarius quietus]